MIQRKQTLYLVLSAILMIACLFMSIGSFEYNTLGKPSLEIYNLCIRSGAEFQVSDFYCAGLFACLVAASLLSILNIFGYKDLRKQSRMCLKTMILQVLWVGLYAVLSSALCPEGYEFHFALSAALPVVAIVFQILARKGIRADHDLLKSVDRIR